MKNKSILLTSLLLFILWSSSIVAQPGLYVESGDITIQSNASVHVQGDVENLGGDIQNDGELYITGNITNHTYFGPMSSGTGTVYLNGSNPQTMSGSENIHLGDLDLSLGTGAVTLEATGSESYLITNNLTMGNRVLDLNGQTADLTSSSPTALSYVDGYIICENSNSSFYWDIGTTLDTYTVPFGTSSGDLVPMTVTVTSANAATASLGFSTYATNNANVPLPNAAISNMDFDGTDMAYSAIDRFWQVDLDERTADVELTYSPNELTGNEVEEDHAVAMEWAGDTWVIGDSPGNYGGAGSHSFTLHDYTSNFDEWIAIASPPVKVHIQVLLEGPYDAEAALMTTDLRAANLLPAEQPFNRSPWNYDGIEALKGGIAAIPDNVVDWVLIELRSGADIEQIVSSRAAFLLNDGTVQDIYDAIDSGVELRGITPGMDYYLIVRTRNHLATISQFAATLPNSAAVPYDFTDASQVLDGTGQMTPVSPTAYAQRGGDYNSDGVMTVADFNFFSSESSIINEYRDSDGNMDRAVTVADFNLYQPHTSVIGVPQIRY